MGFWSNLFGTGKGPAYFLEDDDAKTFGDIDYMRRESVVERTYPKGKAEDIPVDKFVPPAMGNMGSPKMKDPVSSYVPQQPSYTPPTQSYTAPIQNYTPPAPTTPSAPEAPKFEAPKAAEEAPKFEPPAPKSTGSNDMDMFRNMAKGLGR